MVGFRWFGGRLALVRDSFAIPGGGSAGSPSARTGRGSGRGGPPSGRSRSGHRLPSAAAGPRRRRVGVAARPELAAAGGSCRTGCAAAQPGSSSAARRARRNMPRHIGWAAASRQGVACAVPRAAEGCGMADAPPLAGVLETALYVDDMARARGFYEAALGLSPMFADERLTAYPVGGRSALLVFLRGSTTETVHCPAAPSRRMTGMARCIARWPSRGGPAGLGGAAGGAGRPDRGPHAVAARQHQHLFPRPRRAPAGTGDARPLAGLVTARVNRFPTVQGTKPCRCQGSKASNATASRSRISSPPSRSTGRR